MIKSTLCGVYPIMVQMHLSSSQTTSCPWTHCTKRVAKHVISRYNSLAALTYVGARSLSNSVSQGSWMSWLQAQFFFTNNHQLPTRCTDKRDPYTPLKPEPMSKPNIKSSLPDHFAMLDAEDGSDAVLRVSFAASIPHGSFDIGLPPNVKERVKDIPDTFYQLSQHLHEVNASLKKSNARAIEKGDQICVLDGCTHIAFDRLAADSNWSCWSIRTSKQCIWILSSDHPDQRVT